MAETTELSSSHQSETTTHQQNNIPTKRKKGGLRTMPFIIANEGLEKASSYGVLPNMILYLMKEYKLELAKGTNILFLWTAATNFMPVVGAFLSDSYLGRFLTIGFGCIANLLGMVALWLTAMIPQLRPPPCNQSSGIICKPSTSSQMTVLLSSFALMSLGAGGIRSSSVAFGADQLDRTDNPKNDRVLESFFSWYYASAALSVVAALTGLVYIQDHLGWKVGFGVPVALMFLSTFFFFLASPLYIKHKASKSLLTGLAQVVVVAYKNRKLPLPPHNSKSLYHHGKDSELVAPTIKLRSLNKACLIKDPEQDIGPNGSAKNPWSLCTIEQVEELKALIKVIPMWSTGIIMSIIASQSSFTVIQATSMNRHITSSASGFQIPAGSFETFTVASFFIWVVVYDRILLPAASKIRGNPVRFGVKQRMGFGLFLSGMAMVVSAIVENVRRRKAIQQGLVNNAQAVVHMSALWLVPQQFLKGLAEALNAIGQTEFYYTEFPKSMSSIASSLYGLGMAVANLLATVILSAVDDNTSRGGKESWVSSNPNRGHYDKYFWVLAIMSFLNFFYYLGCSWAYGPCAVQAPRVCNGVTGSEEELSRLGLDA